LVWRLHAKMSRRSGAKPSAAPSQAPARERSRSRQRPGADGDTISGIIIRYEEIKGFGFIKPDEGGEDVFFLKVELPPEMSAASRREEIVQTHVEFELEERPDGKMRAKRCVLLEAAPGFNPDGMSGGDDTQEPIELPSGAHRTRGRIVRWDRTKGYGFVKCPGEAKDVFFIPSVLPTDLRDKLDRGENLEHLEVEVDVIEPEEGKPRAERVVPVGGPVGGPGVVRRQGATQFGVILRFESHKGFGFIDPDDFDEDIFFQRMELPPPLRESQHKEQVVGRRVEFEVKTMPDGKKRALRCTVAPPAGTKGAPLEIGQEAPCTGKIRRFDRGKGFGFIEVPGTQDVFFLPSCLPPDMRHNLRDNLEGVEVNFVYYVNEEGKTRGKDIQPVFGNRGGGGGGGGGFNHLPPPPFMGMPPMAAMFGMPPPQAFMPPPPVPQGGHGRQERDRDRRRDDEDAPPLDHRFVADMMQFLIKEGGSMDFGKFTSRFQRVKKRQLQEHFVFTEAVHGLCRIELPPGHPDLRDREEDDGIMEEEERGPDMDGGPPPDEPAIVPSEGCQPQGRIHSYDPGKGFGFVKVEGFKEDIYFHRNALPTIFHGKNRSEMPDLVGCEVGVEMGPPGDKGPKAERLHLHLTWHRSDRCWLLKRQ